MGCGESPDAGLVWLGQLRLGKFGRHVQALFEFNCKYRGILGKPGNRNYLMRKEERLHSSG